MLLAQGRSVAYNRDIAPILREHCTSCHRPDEFAPFSLVTYEDAVQHASQIVDVTRSRYMPPWKPEEKPARPAATRHANRRRRCPTIRSAESSASPT